MELQLELQVQRGHSGHTGFPSVALEIKLQMEHCMPVIHRVRVDFNIPSHPTHSTAPTKSERNPPYENGVGTRILPMLCIQWQVPVPQDLQHAKLSPQSALPFVWILLQGLPRGCYKSPVTPWPPSVMDMVKPPTSDLQVWTPLMDHGF